MEILNTYHTGVPTIGNASGELLAVLTVGATGRDYAVYIGIVKLPEVGAADYDSTREMQAWKVAASGAKQSYRNALAYFPTLKESEYRA